MRTGRPSRTARQNALFRALDARHPAGRRVADDRLAVRFLTPEYRLLAELARAPFVLRATESVIDRRWPCARAGVVVRTRLLDEMISRALPDVAQVLMLGAGFDSRAYRLPGIDAVRVFEVDHPATQAAKQRVLRRGAGVPAHVCFVPVVFGTDDPARALLAAGFAPDVPTLVLWEGVTNYLDGAAVDSTFSMLASLLGTGSPVLFTYVHRGILDGSASFDGAETTMQAVQRVGEPFTFGFDPDELPGYLAARGFDLVSDHAISESAARVYRDRPRPATPAYYHVVEARKP